MGSLKASLPLPTTNLSVQRDVIPVPIQYQSPPLQYQSPPSSSSPNSRISPAVLFIIIILAVIFFISGLLHLLVRFIIRKHNPQNSSSSSPPSPSDQNPQNEISNSSEVLQRQLQQLFHLHDSGLDQAFIDALPIFNYKEIIGTKEPFDCAVCLCEFSNEDKLRLLPLCGHAFHLSCIDTWLLSNSTCPLCRGAIFVPGVAIENPVFEFEFDDLMMEEGRCSVSGRKSSSEVVENAAGKIGEKLVLPVRLGKFKNVNKRDVGENQDTNLNPNSNLYLNGVVKREEGESSSSNLDARRCYSMGSYQYVLGDSSLKVSLCTESKRFTDAGTRIGFGPRIRGTTITNNNSTNEGMDGKRISASSKGDSFSVSKIWQWQNNKGKMPVISKDIASSKDGSNW